MNLKNAIGAVMRRLLRCYGETGPCIESCVCIFVVKQVYKV